jgi:hypothetical protein
LAQPSQEQWAAFLLRQVDDLLPNNPHNVIQTKVDQFAAALQLGDINPTLAVKYYKDCPQGGDMRPVKPCIDGLVSPSGERDR